GSGLLRRLVPPGRGVRRAGRPAGAGTYDGRGAPRAVRVTPLSADPPGPPGVRQGMTADVKNRQTLWVLLAIIGALVVASFLVGRSEEHTSELQSRSDLVCRLLLEKKKKKEYQIKYNTPRRSSDGSNN